jgi:hypothetical protein
MYYMGMSYWEAYNIPVQYRVWFIHRIQKELKRSSDDGSGASRALHHNTPDVRSMQGMTRDAVPARLRRFS